MAAAGIAAALFGVAARAQTPQPSAQATTPQCRISGHVTSGGTPIPGAAIVVRVADAVQLATSSGVDGAFAIHFAPNTTYQLSVDASGFTGATRDLTLGDLPCDQTVDVEIPLAPQHAAEASAPQTAPAAATTAAPAAAGTSSRGRFQTLSVQPNSAAGGAESQGQPNDDITRLLPAGFSAQSAQADAIAITGSGNAAGLDRGLMNGRQQAINSGQLDPIAGSFNEPAGFGGPGGFGRGGGPGGPSSFVLGGRGATGQPAYRGSANYTFGGSALNTAPYQLRADAPVSEPPYAQNNFGATFGGPFKIPGIYANTDYRTSFQINYSGNASSNVFDQYATVPTDAMRGGDFSASSIAIIDPATGQPFLGNQIPANRVDASAASLLHFIPAPNLPGDQRNYHTTATSSSSSQAVSLRMVQNLSPAAAQGGPGSGRVDQPSSGSSRSTNAVLSGQLQYRRSENESLNVFPGLGGTTVDTRIAAPVNLMVSRGRSMHFFNVNAAHADSETTNAFANTENVAGDAGIQYPNAASTDPANWGVPNLTFSGFTGVRGATTTGYDDTRISTGYAWLRRTDRHRLRVGGDYRYDASGNQINSNARGSFTFTGFYTSGGDTRLGATGADFADFLLGLPQQASLEVGGSSRLRQHAFDAFIEDNWQRNAKLTLNLGLRYELAKPYVEVSGRMANLDATSDLSAVAPVLPGAVGPYTGAFPAGLLNTDANNVAPRLGMAYKLTPSTMLRGGYGITYNSGSYASIARELAGQPPFADATTVTGTLSAPLTLAEALLAPTPPTTNNWGVDRDYALGMIQTWNATFTRTFTQTWVLQVGYTGIKGSDLDILRAPTRGPGGVALTSAQPFIWESSGGHSLMNAANVQLQRRLTGGIGGAVSYTLARSMDNASSLGAGGAVVAQNDKDLNAEYSLSNFDRRQQVSANVYVELPWGPNRHWLRNGGVLAGIIGEWTAQLTLTLQSGTPLTARVLGAANDLLRGVNGSLRADYIGRPIPLSNPTVDEFFNVNAFSIPPPGQFGDSFRNMITGPGVRQLNASFQRDVRLSTNRSLTLQVNAQNLLNTVQWAAIDTNINSPTFGSVLSARPMRTITISARLRF